MTAAAYLIVTSLVLVSAIFLGKALRQLSKQFSEGEHLELAKKTMVLNMTVLCLYVASAITFQIARVLY